MGLLVMALAAAFLAYFRHIVSWFTGIPVPQVAIRQRNLNPVMRFFDGIGKVKMPHRDAKPTSFEQIEQWRMAANSADKSALPLAPQGLDCDVLIVGAGPNGLMMAALLQRSGLRVRIIDKSNGPAQESRAFAVQARTIELFRNLNTCIKFHIKGKHVGGLDFDRSKATDSPYQFILMAPQNEVEGLLLADLNCRNLQVERETELISLSQSADEVTAEVARGGRTQAIVCRHIVGADGAHSAVRKQLGLSFDGGKYAQNFLLADCKIEWPFDHTHFRIFMNGERVGLFLPLKGKEMSRVMATDLEANARGNALDDAHHGLAPAQTTLQELESSLAKAMCVPIKLSNPIWTTRYRVNLRGVERYGLGRAFLVGDAAHIHSPAGGQGMNTGFQDAANLAWKIALVQRTKAPSTLLDSYHDERHPVGIQLLRFTDRLYKVAADLQGWQAWMRDFLGPFLIGRMSAAPIPHRKSFRRLSQIGLEYRVSHINVNELLYSLNGPLAGQRAPDARISTQRQMFDILTGYQFHVVAFSRKHLVDEEVKEYEEQLQSIAAFGFGISTHLIGRVACRRDSRVEYVDSGQVFEHYGLKDEESTAIYVIRPDGYVAWRMDEINFDACRSFLARLHGGFAEYEAKRLASMPLQ
jgi:2-polyprenyl-6-methoxyphenol hydroxylase-like FAD-dependent oxidoreductase